MAGVGLNLSSDGRYDPSVLAATGARWVRVVAQPHVDLTDWMQRCRATGLKVLLVLASESFAGLPNWSTATEAYRIRYGGLIDAIQAGNEADHVSGSSWSMKPADLSRLIKTVRLSFPTTTLVASGMVSGNPAYLDNVDLGPADFIAVHPYGQRAEPTWPSAGWGFGYVGSLLDAYARHGKKVWVTEVGLPVDGGTTETFQADYCGRMLRTLSARPDVPVVCWFAYHPDVPGFGLIREDGSKRPAWQMFKSVAVSQPAPPVEFVLGFKRFHDAMPGIVGEPKTRPEFNSGFPGWQVQTTTSGILSWHQGDGMVFVGNNERVWRWPDGAPTPEEVLP
jgi:hypothetical protein